MDIVARLPEELARKFFLFFEHPTSKLIKLHNSPQGKLMEDIRDYPVSLKQLYSLPYAKDHDGSFGRARLLNSLWMEAHYNFGDYYKIWKRMFRVHCERTAEWWIRWRYAVNCHKYQINSLWALFTKEERRGYLQKHIVV